MAGRLRAHGINQKIAAYDSLIEELAEEPGFKALVCRAMEVYGVGILGATALVAAIDCDPGRFEHARDVGPYLGTTPPERATRSSARRRRATTSCAGSWSNARTWS